MLPADRWSRRAMALVLVTGVLDVIGLVTFAIGRLRSTNTDSADPNSAGPDGAVGCDDHVLGTHRRDGVDGEGRLRCHGAIVA